MKGSGPCRARDEPADQALVEATGEHGQTAERLAHGAVPQDERGKGADGRPGQDVAWVVGSHRDARDAQYDRHSDRDPARLSVPQEQRDRDREGRRRVIAREGRIAGRGDEEMRARMSDVRARTRPDVGDDVREPECQQRAESRGNHAVASVHRTPLAGHEEQHREQSDERVLQVERAEAERVLDKTVVRSGEIVQLFEEREVDAPTLARR